MVTALRERAVAVAAVRAWFAEHGYVEVTTPTLVRSAAMEETLFPIAAGDGFLRTSPEFALKRVVASGMPRVFEIGPCYRDREHGPWHAREFTMLEWYRAGASLADLMAEVRQLVATVARALGRPEPGPWVRHTIRELFLRDGVDLARAEPRDIAAEDDWDLAFMRRWVERIEPTLSGAQIVERWPASQAALAQIRDDAHWPYAERFEVFLDGVELANAFLELRDPIEQRHRFHQANATRTAAGEPPNPIDEAFVAAVGKLPPCAGIAMGVDRLVTALTGRSDIHIQQVSP